MKNLKDIVIEKLVINKDSKLKSYSDDELMNDYQEVNYAYTKAEKKVIADKYGIADLRIRPIQLHILELLRENRKNKEEFNISDLQNFFRFDIPDTYNKFEVYLKQESDEFVEYLYDYYKNLIDNNSRLSKFKYAPQMLSMAERHKIKIFNNLAKYLHKD